MYLADMRVITLLTWVSATVCLVIFAYDSLVLKLPVHHEVVYRFEVLSTFITHQVPVRVTLVVTAAPISTVNVATVL